MSFWFHTFALNRAAGLYTPGVARDHRYRIPALLACFDGLRADDVGDGEISIGDRILPG